MLDGVDDRVVSFGRRLQDMALSVEQPAVVRARDAALFHAAVAQRGAAMAAAIADQANAATLVSKQDEVFAQYAHKLRGLLGCQFSGYGDRHPVAAK